MIEIKFRGFNRKTNKWIYGYYVKFEDFHHIIPTNSDWDSDFLDKDIEVVSESIDQFTGLKDKKGKEIYKGDIVEWERTNGVDTKIVRGHITFVQGMFVLKDGDGGEWGIVTCRINVIGNRFENPELLEEKR